MKQLIYVIKSDHSRLLEPTCVIRVQFGTVRP
jgi:hypothetical protein